MALDAGMTKTLRQIYEASLVSPFYGYANPANPLVRALQKQGYIIAYGANQNPDDAKQYSFQCTALGAAEFPPADAPAAAETQIISPGSVAPLATVLASAPAAPAAPGVTLTKSGRPRKARGPNKVTEPPKIMTPTSRISLSSLPPAPARSGFGGKRGPRTEKYPFSQLLPPDESGLDSRFIASTHEMPNPAKTLQSNVTKANKKFGPERHFVIRYVEKDVEFQIPGARLFRDK